MFMNYDMRFKPRGPTTFLTEFQTLAPVLVSAKETKQVITRTGDIIRLRIVLHMDTTDITEIDNICPLIVWYSYQVRKTFGIRRLRARWNFCVQLCRKTALPGNETVMGVNFNTFLTFWADMRRLRCFCVTGFKNCAPDIAHGTLWLLAGLVLLLYYEAHLHERPLISVIWRVCCLCFWLETLVNTAPGT